MKYRKKWIFIFALIIFILYLVYQLFFRQYLIIYDINKNTNIEGLQLLESKNDVISNLGRGEDIPHLGFGSVMYYDNQKLEVGIINDKLNSLNTLNSKHSLFDIHVGNSFSDAQNKLLSKGFKVTNSKYFKKGRFIILLGTENETISKIHIWYDNPKNKNKTS